MGLFSRKSSRTEPVPVMTQERIDAYRRNQAAQQHITDAWNAHVSELRAMCPRSDHSTCLSH